jgi:hypothetical protein
MGGRECLGSQMGFESGFRVSGFLRVCLVF